MTKGLLDLVAQVAGILDDLDIRYALGGSMASSFFGEPRMTADADMAVLLPPGRGAELLRRAETEFYVPVAAARAAMEAHTSFNLIDTSSGLKVDLFVLGDGPLDQLQIDRRITVTIPGIDREICVTAPEVQVLRKLDWYRQTDESARQWNDVVGILRTADSLDTAFLDEAARTLGLDDLLADALAQAAD